MSVDSKKDLTNFSFADFSHDFAGTKVLNPVKKALEMSRPNESKLSIVEYNRRRIELLSKLSKKNIFEFFKDEYKKILPKDSKLEKLYNEDDILKTIGLNYVSIQQKLINFYNDGYVDKKNLLEPIKPEININGKKLNYEIRTYPTKVCGTNYSLPAALKKTTNTNKFVLIFDCSYFPTTSIKSIKEQYIK